MVRFAASRIAAGLLVNGIWTYATADHRLVRPDLDERLIRGTQTWGWVAPVRFLGSIGVSFFSADLAQYTRAEVFVIQRFGRRYLVSRHAPDRGRPWSG